MKAMVSRMPWPGIAVAVIAAVVATAAHDPLALRSGSGGSSDRGPAAPGSGSLRSDRDDVVAAIDRYFSARWNAEAIEPAVAAEDLTVLRRFWLAVAGTIPSLEEIRRFEADGSADRVDHAIDGLLGDRRAAEGLARRLATVFVGETGGQFIVFRRDRFTTWLADAIHAGRPWDRIARDMVASRGLWTDTPAVNFVTQAADGGRIDPNKLAGRVARVFLGQRIDCAQCHDHPFAAWRQRDFEGLAACFAQARLSGVGVEDDPRRVYRVDAMTAVMGGGRNVPPRVPFGEEWFARSGTHRENLAAWLVHPENRRFDRAIVNRVWGILFGRAWREPVDDLPDPPAAEDDLLDLLADDFKSHGRDLRRLFSVLASTRVFRLASAHPLLDSTAGCVRVERAWAAFPITRLRPEQVIGAMVATTSLRTIDQRSHLLTRAIRFFREVDFVREYGVVQEGQGGPEPATIPQTLVCMNGRLVREMVQANAVTATGRIAGMARTDDSRLEIAFLVALTRRPTVEERRRLTPVLTTAATKGRGAEDIAWALVNAAEFCWNH